MAATVTEARVPGSDRRAEGGFTAVPRWARIRCPAPGSTSAASPARSRRPCRARARELGVPLTAASSRPTRSGSPCSPATSRCAAATWPRAWTAPLPFELTVGPGTWRRLVLDARRAEAAALSPGTGSPSPAGGPEAVFAPAGHEGDVPLDGTVLLGISAGEELLRLRHRTDLLDADCAARIGGYHRAALEAIAADPDAPHDRGSLLSADELRFQLDGGGAAPCAAGPPVPRTVRGAGARASGRRRRGPPGPRPDVRGPRHPGQPGGPVPAGRGARPGGHGRRGDRARPPLGGRRARRPQGRRRRVPARRPASPARPHRRDAHPRRLLVRPHHTRQHRSAGPGARHAARTRPLVPHLTDRATDGTDLGLDIPADRLAYVFFTSGSTGEPKGALCEHGGLLNHLYAKIDDLGIGEGTVVAQTASQCFDISLWQLLAGLLTGGRTLLVEQDAILDADLFLETGSPRTRQRPASGAVLPRRRPVRAGARPPGPAGPAVRLRHRRGAAR
ncbi:D-alanine--D-alanyl carrier protein ligase [Streptomyces purpurascens]